MKCIHMQCIYMNSWSTYNEMHLSTERVRCSNCPENVQYDFPEVQVGGGQVGGSPKLAPNSILMVLVDLDVNQIVGYHYFDHHQPSRGSSVRLPLSLAQVESFSLVRGLVGAKVWLLLEEIHPDNGQRLEKAIR